MDQSEVKWQEIESASPREVLARVAALDGLQIVTRADGVVHEQFGAFALADQGDHVLMRRGDESRTRLALGAVRRTIISPRGGTTAEPAPRVDFLDAEGEILLSVLAPAVAAAFKAVLEGFSPRTLAETLDAKGRDSMAVEGTDPAVAPLLAVARSGRPVAIEFGRRGVHSSWRGVVAGLRLGPRNINIIQDDFHLHLQGGAIDRWERNEAAYGTVEQQAVDAGGRPIGLVIRGESATFA